MASAVQSQTRRVSCRSDAALAWPMEANLDLPWACQALLIMAKSSVWPSVMEIDALAQEPMQASTIDVRQPCMGGAQLQVCSK